MDTILRYKAPLETDVSNRADEVCPEMAHLSLLPVRSQGGYLSCRCYVPDPQSEMRGVSGFRSFYPGTVPLHIQAFTPCTFEKDIMFLNAGITWSSMGLSSR